MGHYSLSFWDALLIAACLEAGARALYSENFSGYDEIDGLKTDTTTATARHRGGAN
jgi:predicted nucleic acid-binding protein